MVEEEEFETEQGKMGRQWLAVVEVVVGVAEEAAAFLPGSKVGGLLEKMKRAPPPGLTAERMWMLADCELHLVNVYLQVVLKHDKQDHLQNKMWLILTSAHQIYAEANICSGLFAA